MLSNQFRSFYDEGILSTNLILYTLYMSKPIQQQMKWEKKGKYIDKERIGFQRNIHKLLFYLPRKMVCRLLLSACRYNNGDRACSS